MARRLEDKAIIVIGAGTNGDDIGNGKAAAVQFAREGARVLCVDRDEGALMDTIRMIENEGGAATACVADIAKWKDCERVAATCIAKFEKIDVLHNNAGVAASNDFLEMEEDDWDRVFDVNVKGIFMMCRFTIPWMIKNGGGSIINISSIFSIRPGSEGCYVASKSAVDGITRFIARKYARHNIRANALLLGYIDTPLARPAWDNEKIREINLRQVPMHRFGSPWEGAMVAAFLASDESSYLTGLTLPVDGGLSLSM